MSGPDQVKWRALLSVSLVAFAGVLAGCGGSDSTSQDISRAEYIARVDRICARINAEVRKLNERIGRLSDQSTEEEQLRDVAPILREAHGLAQDGLDELHGVPVPDGEEEQIKAFVSSREQQTALLGEAADAAREQDVARYASTTEAISRANARVRGTAKGYGFKECGAQR